MIQRHGSAVHALTEPTAQCEVQFRVTAAPHDCIAEVPLQRRYRGCVTQWRRRHVRSGHPPPSHRPRTRTFSILVVHVFRIRPESCKPLVPVKWHHATCRCHGLPHVRRVTLMRPPRTRRRSVHASRKALHQAPTGAARVQGLLRPPRGTAPPCGPRLAGKVAKPDSIMIR